MASSCRTRSSCPVLPMKSSFHRPISPPRIFYTPTASTNSSSQPDYFRRSSSPTRVNISTVRFSMDHPSSPGRSLTRIPNPKPLSATPASHRKMCMCSPTTHPGSFRCSLHKNLSAASSPSNRLNAHRSAMTNSLVRIGTVEGGDWVKRALAALIRPSSQQRRRRAGFHPRPSRLSIMSSAEDSY